MKLFVTIFLFITIDILFGQKLVFSENFEVIDKSKILSSNIEILNGWNAGGLKSYCVYCNKNFNPDNYELSCNTKSNITYHDGEGMVKLKYVENCPFNSRSGCATYIYKKLSSPLKIGLSYSVGIWVYVPNFKTIEPSFYKSIGVTFANSPGTFASKDESYVAQYPYFNFQAVNKNTWSYYKYVFTPLCELNYIIFGIFKNDNFPKWHRPISNDYYFFIDDITIFETKFNSQHKYFCPTIIDEDKNGFEIRNKLTFYFDVNSFDKFNKKEITFTDSTMCKNLLNSCRLIILDGYSDETGNEKENILLAENRNNFIMGNIISNCKIPKEYFITRTHAFHKSGTKNTAEIAKQRRVEISISEISISNLYYKKAIDYCQQKNIDSTQNYLKKWVLINNGNNSIIICFDPRFSNFRNDIKYKEFIKNYVLINYSSYNAFLLDSMYFIDQKYRTLADKLIYNSGYYDSVETELSVLNLKDKSKLINFDNNNLDFIEKFILHKKIPIISQVGRRPASTLLIILNHSENLKLIEKYLTPLFNLCIEGEIEWNYYAMLKDKYLKLNNCPQIYGTQYENKENGQLALYRYDNLDSVNLRRVKIGMPELEKE